MSVPVQVVDRLVHVGDVGESARQRIFHGRGDRPLVDDRVDGTWRRGRLYDQVEDPFGEWWLRVRFYDPDARSARIGRFAVPAVRRVAARRAAPVADAAPATASGVKSVCRDRKRTGDA